MEPLTSSSDEIGLTQRDVMRFINLGDKNQYEGNYQEATKKYLQALEVLCQILNNTSEVSANLASLRALILANLGNNLVYVGQYNIAIEFYEQQLRVATGTGDEFDLALAYHKIGFCQYFMGLYESSIEFQKKSLEIVSKDNNRLDVSQLQCKIYAYLGLSEYALNQHETALDNYEKALGIARENELQNEEAEIIANSSFILRESQSLEYGSSKVQSLEKLRGDLYYVTRISNKNPYVKSLALRELANTYKSTDIEIAYGYFEDALNLAKNHSLAFLKNLQSDLNEVLHKKQELVEQKYILEEQSWYCLEFPKTQEIDEEKLESLVFQPDFVIITATPIELKATVRLLTPHIPEEALPFRRYTRWGTYYLGKFGCYDTVVTQCRMGTRDERGAGFVTQKALEIWKPKAVIMVGIAFGKNLIDQKIGDVLVATEIIDYDVNRIGLDGIVDRGSRPPSNRNLLDIFEQAHEWEFKRPDGSHCKLISGPVLSGDKLVDNPDFKADLFRRFPQAKGGEMEGIGFCSAANSLQKPWILIKAICDWADGNKNDKYQPLAAAAAVSLVHYVLSQRTILNCFD